MAPEQIRRLRTQHPEMRERDFARLHRLSEAQLVAAFVGEGVTRLNPDLETFLGRAPLLGEIMSLTRNESAVHEKIGPFEKARYGAQASIVLGEQIDLRIFPSKWHSAFAVERADKDGGTRRSIQFFDAAGDAVYKLHARVATDLDAWAELVATMTSTDQSAEEPVEPIDDSETRADAPVASPAELRAEWEKMTDTHQFFPMLRRLNLSRHQAVTSVAEDLAWPLDLSATQALLDGAKGTGLPIMVFVGSRGCIQIHSDPIERVEAMGPWLNVMDPTFHLHLRLDHIAEVWAVRKPTKDGHVTSLEAFGADNRLIIQFFGQRQEGTDERDGWRELVESLPRLNRSNAA